MTSVCKFCYDPSVRILGRMAAGTGAKRAPGHALGLFRTREIVTLLSKGMVD